MEQQFTKLIIEWCTNYNGVMILPDVEDLTDELYEQFESINEEADLPSLTYDIVGSELMNSINEGDEEGEAVEEVVSQEDEDKIIAKAREAVAAVYPDTDFEFVIKFNHTDT